MDIYEFTQLQDDGCPNCPQHSDIWDCQLDADVQDLFDSITRSIHARTMKYWDSIITQGGFFRC